MDMSVDTLHSSAAAKRRMVSRFGTREPFDLADAALRYAEPFAEVGLTLGNPKAEREHVTAPS